MSHVVIGTKPLFQETFIYYNGFKYICIVLTRKVIWKVWGKDDIKGTWSVRFKK